MRHLNIRRLLVALVAIAAVTAGTLYSSSAPAQAAVGDCTPGAWGTSRADYAARVLALVNAHRQSLGLTTLQVSNSLENAAEWKALHMAGYGYMTHEDPAPPVARTTGERLVACGYPSSGVGWGENIAYGYASPEAVMQAWLNSSGHRANIEKASFRTIGIGAAVKTNGTIYWAQTFGTWTSDIVTGTPPVATPTTAPTATPTAVPTATVAPKPTATATPKPTATPRPPRHRWNR